MNIKTFMPTSEQRAIATSKDQTILVEALAGSGKTTTLSYCIAADQTKASPDSILVLVYSDGAKRVFKDRLRSIGITYKITVLTFNEYAENFLLVAEQNGYISSVSIIDSDEKLKPYVLDAINWLSEKDTSQFDEEINYNHFYISQVLDCLDLLKGRMDFHRDFEGYSYDEIANVLGITKTAFLICKSFENIRMLDEGLYRFRSKQDLVHDAVCLLENYHDTRALLPDLSLLIVDEFHDINESKLRLIKMLVGERTRFIAMGDRDQVIHTSLGADPQYMHSRFEQEFPKVKRYQLSESFRFGPSLAFAISSLIKRECISKKMRDTEIKTIFYSDEDECVMQMILALENWMETKNKLNDCVIIARDLSHTILIETTLANYDISYKLWGIEQPYYERFEILMLRGLMHIALNNLSIVSNVNILKKIVRALGVYAELDYTEQEWRAVEFDLVSNPDFLQKYFIHQLIDIDEKNISIQALEWRKRFKDVTLYLKDQVTELSAGDILKYAVKKLDLEATTKRLYVRTADALNVTRNINGFISFAHHSHMSCEELLNQIEKISKPKKLNQRNRYAVNLTTAEMSKGNEWKHVLVPFLERGKFPMTDAIADERRLFYVAISRAIDKLSLFVPSNENQSEPALFSQSSNISSFVHDIDILNSTNAGKKQLKANLKNSEFEEMVFLDVRFEEKEQVKKLGAKWDSVVRKWYVPSGNSLKPFTKWLKKSNE